jgi:hypothetical protein
LPPACFLLSFCWFLLFPAHGSDWPSWRGPGGIGVSDEPVPIRWSQEENIAWEFKDPGLGHSSPIVWKNALFLNTAAGESRLLIRLDTATGREVWKREVLRAPLEKKHQKNSFASSTPATDGERVYNSFLNGENVVLTAFDLDGKEIWRVSPGEFHSIHGFSSTPVIFGDLVLLNCDQDAYAYLIAFDRRTGETRWKTERENRVRSYCTPTIFTVDGKPQMVLSGSKTVAAYNPLDGKRIWVCDGPTEQCVASLVYGRGLVFVTGGFPDREFLAIDPTGTGEVTKTHIRWRANRGVSYVPSPLYIDGCFYVVSDTGVLSALDALTGEYKNQKRLRGNFSASLLHAGGCIYSFSEEGEVFVLRARPELETVSEIQMDDPIYATPAVSEGRMYLRTWKKLYAIGKKA